MLLTEILKPWILNIVVVIFFLILSDILLPEGNIKQYIKVILGLFVILVIIKPLLSIKSLDYNFENIYIETSAFLEVDSYDKDIEALQDYHKKSIRAQYLNNIKNAVTDAVSKELDMDRALIHTELDPDENGKNEYELPKGIFVTINGIPQDTDIKKIKKVRIPHGKKVINDEEKEYNFNEKAYTENLRNIIIRFIPIEKDRIQIKFIENGGDTG